MVYAPSPPSSLLESTVTSTIEHVFATPPIELPDGSGTGRSLPTGLLALATISSLSATIVSLATIYVHLKNYRKPHLQRFVVRLILIVPIYATSSCIGLFSLPAAFLIDLIRDLYEAFAIYCFFELLVAYLGGERSVLILMIGRRPVAHPWPFNILLREMDMSDPYTFLAIKRGILQYVQIKPILAVSTIILKSIGRYEEGALEAGNGYTYVSTVYNISIFLSLYCLAIFWKALAPELEPFRPTAKFLTVKGVVFATFWQGWAISVFVASGLVKSIGPISDPSFLRLGLQDLLLTLEMPLFALGHMYAFSHRDYVDTWATHQARLPITYALRDALGGRDVLEDSLTTIRGTGYGYQTFEPSQGAVHQGLARTRRLHAGLRYTAGGKGKYFLPSRAIHASVPWAEEGTRIQGPLSAVKKWMEERRLRQGGFAPMTEEEEANVVHENPDNEHRDERDGKDEARRRAEAAARRLGQGLEAGLNFFTDHERLDEAEDESLGFHTPKSSGSEENLYSKARGLEHGDYAFPTIACVPEEERKRRWREEEEWLLGGAGSRRHIKGKGKDGSVASRERRKHVEGWLDRMRGFVHGSEQDPSNESTENNKSKRPSSSVAEGGANSEQVRGKKRRSSTSSSAKRKDATSASPRTGKSRKNEASKTRKGAKGREKGSSSRRSVWGRWANSPSKKTDGREVQDAGDQTQDSIVTEPDDSTVTAKDGSESDDDAGAVDLIVADSLEEQRKRDTERRRGDPALRTGQGEKRVFRRIWTGGSGRVATLKSLQNQDERNEQKVNYERHCAAEGVGEPNVSPAESVPKPEPSDSVLGTSKEGHQAVQIERPEGDDGYNRSQQDVVLTSRDAEPKDAGEGRIAIEVEAPSLASVSLNKPSQRNQQGYEDKDAITEARGIKPGLEKDRSDSRDPPSDFTPRDDIATPTKPNAVGEDRSSTTESDQTHHMPIYRPHDWRWHPADSDAGEDTNPWA